MKEGRWIHYFECEKRPEEIIKMEREMKNKLEWYIVNMNCMEVVKDYGCKKLT